MGGCGLPYWWDNFCRWCELLVLGAFSSFLCLLREYTASPFILMPHKCKLGSRFLASVFVICCCTEHTKSGACTGTTVHDKAMYSCDKAVTCSTVPFFTPLFFAHKIPLPPSSLVKRRFRRTWPVSTVQSEISGRDIHRKSKCKEHVRT